MTLFILDCGARGGTFYHDTYSYRSAQLPNDEVINLQIPGLANGDTIIIEDAHLRAREGQSLAQPFTYDQLVKLAKNAAARDIAIKLFPQQSTPKARDFAGGVEKDDINDIEAIGAYLTRFPELLRTMKVFVPKQLSEFQATQEHRWVDRDGLSVDINAARNFGYGDPKKGDYTDGITDWINNNLKVLVGQLTDRQKELLGIKVVYKGKANERIDYNRGRFYTLVATLIRADGTHRLRSDVNKLPYWKYVKENYFCMTPFHMKGGVAASNIKHHWRPAASSFKKTKRSDIINNNQYDEFRQARATFDKELRELWNLVRNQVVVPVN